MHFTCRPPAGGRGTIFKLYNTPLSFLLDGDIGLFLGKPVGPFLPREIAVVDDLCSRAIKILSSKLASWQRIDCLKTFFFPGLWYFLMRTNRLGKDDWRTIDDTIRVLVRKTLNVPNNSCNDYLYGYRESGLPGVPLAAEDSDIANVDGAVKLLLPKDPVICDIAWTEVRDIANWRFDNDNYDNILKYLNSVAGIRNSNRYKSQWFRARAASGRIGLTWDVREPDLVSVAFGNNVAYNRNQVFRSLRSTFRKNRALKLQEIPHQGKTAHCFGLSKASSHFITEGKFMTFRQWRFAHRARLGIVPLNAYKHGPVVISHVDGVVMVLMVVRKPCHMSSTTV